jgi:uncharacterized protein YdeI (BOF family)
VTIGKPVAAHSENANAIPGGFTMKKFLLHFSLATAVTLLTLAIAPSMFAQQSDQDPAPATPQQAAAQQQQQNEAQMPSSGDTKTHEAKAFTGRIAKENGELVLKDSVTKVSYKLDDPAKAKQYVGKQVKVTGKLDMNSNTIQVEGIEPLS